MEFSLHSYKPGLNFTPAFYIQCKGLNSGQPLRKPIPNCFAVKTNDPNLFHVVYALFVSRAFYSELIGSVIPFIRIHETKKVISKGILLMNKDSLNKTIKALELLESHITIQQEQTKTLKQYRIVTAKHLFKK
jgi:hypothetical protein